MLLFFALAAAPAQTQMMMDVYASQDPLAGKPVLAPPALQGRVRECVPRGSWILLRQTETMCFYFERFPVPIRGTVLTVEEARQRRAKGDTSRCGAHPWDPRKVICESSNAPLGGRRPNPADCYVDPSLPPNVQAEARRYLPVECRQAEADAGFIEGLKAGLGECGKPYEVMWNFYQAMRRGEFARAAQLLGIKDSASGLRFFPETLKALWEDINTQALDSRESKVAEFEKGRRQAVRICTWVMIPAAAECGAAGAACALRTAKRAGAVCERAVETIRRANPYKPKGPLPVPRSPLFRGLLLEDQKLFQRLAALERKIFIIRDANPAALRWVGRDGYKAKPAAVKGKTLKREDLSAAEAEYEGLASARGMDPAEYEKMAAQGYKADPKDRMKIIRDKDGNAFYSDIDLHGVYNTDGTPGLTPGLMNDLECSMFDRGVQHTPHDVWPDRNSPARAGSNYGPQIGGPMKKTVTAIFPDGQMVQVSTLAEMKQLYRAIGVDFGRLYPGF